MSSKDEQIEQTKKVMELRSAGLSIRKIAAELGLGKSMVCKRLNGQFKTERRVITFKHMLTFWVDERVFRQLYESAKYGMSARIRQVLALGLATEAKS